MLVCQSSGDKKAGRLCLYLAVDLILVTSPSHQHGRPSSINSWSCLTLNNCQTTLLMLGLPCLVHTRYIWSSVGVKGGKLLNLFWTWLWHGDTLISTGSGLGTTVSFQMIIYGFKYVLGGWLAIYIVCLWYRYLRTDYTALMADILILQCDELKDAFYKLKYISKMWCIYTFWLLSLPLQYSSNDWIINY